jgi:hypothetical protein
MVMVLDAECDTTMMRCTLMQQHEFSEMAEHPDCNSRIMKTIIESNRQSKVRF